MKNDFVRYSVKCPRCKAAWMEDHVSAKHRAINDLPVFGLRHHCPGTDMKRKTIEESARYRIKRMTDEGFVITDKTYDEVINDLFSLMIRFKTEPVKWKKLSSPTECGPKCMSATGPNCDCRCHGKNHGANKVIGLS